METKSLLVGIIGFIAGALLVSTAATTFDKPNPSQHSMNSITQSLTNKLGEDFDKEFIAQMIAHHEVAVEMAKLSEKQAKHEEIKLLSRDIIVAQEKEISEMRQWQLDWGYNNTTPNHNDH